MAKGKYANAAKAHRIEELEATITELNEKLAARDEQIHELSTERNLLRAKDDSARLAEAAALARRDVAALQARHDEQRERLAQDTARLLMYLVDTLAKVNAGEIGVGQMPGDLPGLLHHFSAKPGELFARVVGAHDSDDPDVAIMGNRRNRRAGVNDYRAEAAHRKERGREVEDETLGDPNAWLARTDDWQDHLR